MVPAVGHSRSTLPHYQIVVRIAAIAKSSEGIVLRAEGSRWLTESSVNVES